MPCGASERAGLLIRAECAQLDTDNWVEPIPAIMLMPRRGFWNRLALCLLGGVALGLMYAWLSVALISFFPSLGWGNHQRRPAVTWPSGAAAGELTWGPSVFRARGGSVHIVAALCNSDSPRFTKELAEANGVDRVSHESLPRWSYTNRAPVSEPVGTLVFEVGGGWPWTAWTGRYRTTFTDHFANLPVASSKGVNLRAPPPGSSEWCVPICMAPLRLGIMAENHPLLLPLRPRFPGVIGNSLIWAAVLAAVPVARRKAGNMRRSRRMRRGLCPGCKYKIGSGGRCPECGTAFTYTDIQRKWRGFLPQKRMRRTDAP